MPRRGALVMLCAVWCAGALCQSEPPARYRVQASYIAPGGDFNIDVLGLSPGQPAPDEAPGYQAWVVDPQRRTNRWLLAEGDAPYAAHITRDGYLIALETQPRDGANQLVLYKKIEGRRYTKMGDVGRGLWSFCVEQEPEAGSVAEASRGTRFVGWSADGMALLAELNGQGAGVSLKGWLVTYDVRNGRAGLDLNAVNQGWPQPPGTVRELLDGLEFPAADRAHDRLQAAFAAATAPSGGIEELPQPGDPIPPRVTPRPMLATQRARIVAVGTPGPPAVPPEARKLRVNTTATALLYALRQRGAGHEPDRDWYCLFDMQTSRPTMDLRVINAGALRQPQETGSEGGNEHGL